MNKLNTYKVEGLRNGSIEELREVHAVNIHTAINTVMPIMGEGFKYIILKCGEMERIVAEIYNDSNYTIY